MFIVCGGFEGVLIGGYFVVLYIDVKKKLMSEMMMEEFMKFVKRKGYW